MITILNKYTGEEIGKCYNANLEFATKDSFCTNSRITNIFRRNWNAVVEYFCQDEKSSFCQCILKDQYIVKNAK